MLTQESLVIDGDIPVSRYAPAGTEENGEVALTGEQIVEFRAVRANKQSGTCTDTLSKGK